jgi:hypothetical protein
MTEGTFDVISFSNMICYLLSDLMRPSPKIEYNAKDAKEENLLRAFTAI